MNENKIKKEFMEAYESLSDAIFRYCLFQTSNRQKALDLSQDTFLKAWEYARAGEKILNYKAFLYKVARNTIIDERRKKKSDSLDNMMEEGFDIESNINENEKMEDKFDAEKAMEIVRSLDEKYREPMLLKFTEDMSIREIAKIIGESENNVAVRIHRGIEKVKEILGEN